MKRSVSRTACGLTAAMVIETLTACSGGQGETKTAASSGNEAVGNIESTAQQEETQAEMKVTAIWKAFDDQSQSEFCIIMRNEAEKLGSIALDIQDAANDVSMANSKLEVVLSEKMDMAAICASDRKSIGNMMRKCGADGVPAVFFDTGPMEDTMKWYDNIWHVGAQAKQSGEMYAQVPINY